VKSARAPRHPTLQVMRRARAEAAELEARLVRRLGESHEFMGAVAKGVRPRPATPPARCRANWRGIALGANLIGNPRTHLALVQ
jgi:hypothetical protein